MVGESEIGNGVIVVKVGEIGMMPNIALCLSMSIKIQNCQELILKFFD